MRVFAAWMAVVLATGVPACGAANADVVSDRLSDLSRALQTVRGINPINTDRDAGPELTPVKQALRRWVEVQLPPPSKPGRIEGTVETPDPQSLHRIANQLTDALDKAGLTCGDFNSSAYRCKAPDDFFESDRGYVGGVQLGLLDYGRYLLVVTDVGVRCGYDESLYLYRSDGPAWKLAFASEQNDYREGVYAPQDITEVAVSDSFSNESASTPSPLVATLGYGPWCSSTWSSLFVRLWRMSATTATPKPLLDRTEFFWWGNDDFGSAHLTDNGLLVQYDGAGIDSEVYKHVRQYRIGREDKVDRIDPIALRPVDFISEWLSDDWAAAAAWLDAGADPSRARTVHREYSPDHGLYTFDVTKGCRSDRTLFQVVLYREPQDSKDRTGAKTFYFQVRWTAPYVFRLVAVSDHSFAGCDIADQAADEPGVSLFPDTQWHPAN